MNVTIFGSASPAPTDPLYQQAFTLGHLLGQAGHTILTGGYMGTMEAASKGAREAGAHVIGVTCAEIERWRAARANPWVAEEWPTQTLSERIQMMLDHSQAFIALPGGPGTLAEISLAWNRLAVDALPPMPLILVGAGWHATFQQFFTSLEGNISPKARALLTFVDTVEQAVACLPNAK